MGLPNVNGFSSSTEIPVETRNFYTLTFRTTHILELSTVFLEFLYWRDLFYPQGYLLASVVGQPLAWMRHQPGAMSPLTRHQTTSMRPMAVLKPRREKSAKERGAAGNAGDAR